MVQTISELEGWGHDSLHCKTLLQSKIAFLFIYFILKIKTHHHHHHHHHHSYVSSVSSTVQFFFIIKTGRKEVRCDMHHVKERDGKIQKI